MAPRWFKNIQFGRDLTNNPPVPDFLENFKANIEKRIQEVTFNSTGPIVEEVESEDEIHIEPTLRIEQGPEIEQEPLVEHNTLIEEESESDDEVEEEPLVEQDTLVEEESESDFEVEEELQVEHHTLIQEKSRSRHEVEHEQEEQAEQMILVDEGSISHHEVEIESEKEPQTEQIVLMEEESVGQQEVEIEIEMEPQTEQRQSIGRVQTQTGLRRSNRKRWAPLDFARGERPIYKRVGQTFEIVGFDQGFPAKYNYGRGPRPKTSAPQVAKKKARIPPNVTPVETVTFKRPKKGDYLYQNKARHGDTVTTGAIRIAPGKSKPESNSGFRFQYMFLVKSGQIIFTVNDRRTKQKFYADEDSDWIVLGRGKRYSIKNCGFSDVNLAYIVTESQEE